MDESSFPDEIDGVLNGGSFKAPLVTLRHGFAPVAHWSGGSGYPSYEQLRYGTGTLLEFLKTVHAKMLELKSSLDLEYRRLDRVNVNNHANRRIIRKFLRTASWAYEVARTLYPYLKYYRGAPTKFLYTHFIYLLEEIFTKCYAKAMVYGVGKESRTGMRGLLRDFEFNGGIHGNGEPGNVSLSLDTYFLGFASSSSGCPRGYRKYAEFLEELVDLVVQKYPKVATAISTSIRFRLESKTHGFGTSYVSVAKTAMIERLTKVVSDLQAVVA